MSNSQCCTISDTSRSSYLDCIALCEEVKREKPSKVSQRYRFRTVENRPNLSWWSLVYTSTSTFKTFKKSKIPLQSQIDLPYSFSESHWCHNESYCWWGIDACWCQVDILTTWMYFKSNRLKYLWIKILEKKCVKWTTIQFAKSSCLVFESSWWVLSLQAWDFHSDHVRLELTETHSFLWACRLSCLAMLSSQ